jgi:PIN domain nuclease of toxin-antitoxin system
MNLLLDTHVFLWWVGNLVRLSPQTQLLLQDPNSILYLSVVSVWEMQIKQQLGKLVFQVPLSEMIVRQQQQNEMKILPVQLRHVMELDHLPLHHKDPFDRLLIAQARIERFHFLSTDPVIDRYEVQRP